MAPHDNNEEEIYQEHILDHYEDPYHRGACAQATHAHVEKNPLCGDVVRVELNLDGAGQIRELFFDGDGCCISQASASMLMEAMDGKRVADVKGFSAEEMLGLYGPRLTPNRQKCCLLAWRALQTALHAPIEGDASSGNGSPGADSTAPGSPGAAAPVDDGEPR